MSPRLTQALRSGELVLPTPGSLSVVLPMADTDMQGIAVDNTQIVQPFKPYFDHFQTAGYSCVTHSDAPCAAAIICLPRAKALARSAVYHACFRGAGLVVVDGAKTDGIDSIYKDIRRRVTILGQLTKAHGRIFWFQGDAEIFADWQAPKDQKADGFSTAPGVFSADAIDPASRFLAEALPKNLGRHVVDLGAGWGYLSHQILAQDAKIETLDLVEADHIALDCARHNVADPRAQFHWANALDWAGARKADGVVMNPPFHTGRVADPSLGRSFIAAAARILTPRGTLWMVANRHLPYEAVMNEAFTQVTEFAGDNRFKILRAERPKSGSKFGAPQPITLTRSRRPRTNR